MYTAGVVWCRAGAFILTGSDFTLKQCPWRYTNHTGVSHRETNSALLARRTIAYGFPGHTQYAAQYPAQYPWISAFVLCCSHSLHLVATTTTNSHCPLKLPSVLPEDNQTEQKPDPEPIRPRNGTRLPGHPKPCDLLQH